MGRLESLSAWALGRGHYEEEVIWGPDGRGGSRTQEYNSKGRPRNLRTKLREKDNVRAANEVMQTTGVVEDADVATAKLQATRNAKTEETITGLRLMEVGRAVLVGGVWGVLGLRRRVLLYKEYTDITLYGILAQEFKSKSMPNLFWAGLPTVVAYHVSEWVAFFLETVVDAMIDEEEAPLTERQNLLKNIIQGSLDVGFCYITLHFRMFAILQQLNLIPASRLFPSARSFIPFSATSPLTFPSLPGANLPSIYHFAESLSRTCSPMLVILLHGKLKYMVSHFIYRPIYKSLPRPIGDSMFAGMSINAPIHEYDTPDQFFSTEANTAIYPSANSPTLRALEGLPATSTSNHAEQQIQPDPPITDNIHLTSSDDDEEDPTPTTIISFDVENTETHDTENAQGTWSASLRTNVDIPHSKPKYRVTGLTMLAPIMATEGIREIVAGILVMPLEAMMVRFIGQEYRLSAGLEVGDLCKPISGLRGWRGIAGALVVQVVVTGVVWAGFMGGARWWVESQRAKSRSEKKGKDGESGDSNIVLVD